MLSRPAIDWGESPHSGHATMYAAAAGVKRTRQAGQQRWVTAGITMCPSRVAVPLWARPAHDGVVRVVVSELEVDPVAP